MKRILIGGNDNWVWFENLPRSELLKLDFTVADWYICLKIMDTWYYEWLKGKR